MSAKTPEEILTAWAESAFYWEKHRPVIRAMFAPITDALIQEAGIQPGDSVLDVAGGPGEPSLTIAQRLSHPVPPPAGTPDMPRSLASSGRVVCTDAVFAMVSAARHEAIRQKLTNIDFAACLGDGLPFQTNLFDVVVSRLGAMFFPDIDAALAELLRVTKPGGRLAMAVWRGP